MVDSSMVRAGPSLVHPERRSDGMKQGCIVVSRDRKVVQNCCNAFAR